MVNEKDEQLSISELLKQDSINLEKKEKLNLELNQSSSNNTFLYQSKIESYSKMKKNGGRMGGVGGGLTVGGIILLTRASWDCNR